MNEKNQKYKIMVVDDEPINIEAINSLFEDDEEYEVFAATCGKPAFDLAKKIKPDIILLDIMMPDIDGYTICQNFKNNPEFKEIPIIFITGIDNEEGERRGFEVGAVDFITKPIRPTITKLRIKNHLKLKRQTDMLKNMSYIDGLTLLYNRRRFEEDFYKEWKRCARSRSWLGLIIIDIDFFKQFNDTYGHLEGDECLKKVANAIKSCVVRGGDTVSRFGGEEFICILPETDTNGVSKVAEKILEKVRSLNIPHEKSSIANILTVSAGATSSIPEENKQPEVLIQNADILLYKAKKSGRNRVEAKDMPMN